MSTSKGPVNSPHRIPDQILQISLRELPALPVVVVHVPILQLQQLRPTFPRRGGSSDLSALKLPTEGGLVWLVVVVVGAAEENALNFQIVYKNNMNRSEVILKHMMND